MTNNPRVYLDNCCFNRPFDDQTSIVIRLETDAKLYIQELIRTEKIGLIWSFVLDYENNFNPFEEIKESVTKWKTVAVVDCDLDDGIKEKAVQLMEKGLRQKDAAHIACAICAKADYFLTTDKKILNKAIEEVRLVNPIDFVRIYRENE